MRVVVTLCMLLIGCGGSEDASTVADTAVTTTETSVADTSAGEETSAGDSSPTTDGSSMAEVAADVAPDVPMGPCNDLALGPTGYLPTFMGGSAPTSSGGAITDGTYELAMVQQYSGSASTTKDYGTVRFTAGVMDRVDLFGKSRASYTIATRFLQLTYTCGSGPMTIAYTATSTMFREYVSYGGGTRVKTYYRK